MSSRPPPPSFSPRRPPPPNYAAPPRPDTSLGISNEQVAKDHSHHFVCRQEFECSCLAASICMVVQIVSGGRYTELHIRDLLVRHVGTQVDWNKQGTELIHAWELLQSFRPPIKADAVSDSDFMGLQKVLLNASRQHPVIAGVQDGTEEGHAIVVFQSTSPNYQGTYIVLDPARGIKYLTKNDIEFLQYDPGDGRKYPISQAIYCT